MNNQEIIKQARDQLFSTRKIICTGNPNRENTIASGIRQLFPDATFLSRSSGWDLKNLTPSDIERLQQQFQAHNTFINASYIGPGVQQQLLEICNQCVQHYEVVNIGSTHEYDGLGSASYSESKQALRKKSLELNSFRFETHHLIVGGIQTQNTPEQKSWITINELCETILWLLNQDRRLKIPMMVIDQPKQPW